VLGLQYFLQMKNYYNPTSALAWLWVAINKTKMESAKSKWMIFFIFLLGGGLIYPLIMSGIFKLDQKSSIIVGAIFGLIGGILWLLTSNIRKRRRAARK